MKRTRWGRLCFFLAASVATLAATGTASAAPIAMRTGGTTTQPVGHYDLCRQSPVECRQMTDNSGPVKLSKKLWAKIVDVNNRVNIAVKPKTDSEMWGVEELWSYPAKEGDCEDYVLMKRHLLMKAGFPAGALLITVVRQPNGEGHAVLTVRTDRGDFILDNLKGDVRLWSETEYQYLKRQSATNSGKWISVRDDRDVAVGSIK
ncbi:MAG TPA: transglutaminase-like cysteine peptidase [Rhizobiaceae bacterium]|nr:transglutaminase-like cysteine peptidase [Rhizobiaceae bacterium]